jgi:hypothetical protein
MPVFCRRDFSPQGAPTPVPAGKIGNPGTFFDRLRGVSQARRPDVKSPGGDVDNRQQAWNADRGVRSAPVIATRGIPMPFPLIPTALCVCFLLMWVLIGGMIFRDSHLAVRRERDADVDVIPLPSRQAIWPRHPATQMLQSNKSMARAAS